MTNKKNNRSHKMRRALALAKLGLAAAALYAAPTLMQLDQAHASGGGGGGMGGGSGGAIKLARDPVAAQECGECHIAYGPGYLPSGSWASIIGGLSNHFGEDASLDPQTQAQITQYYTANSPRGSGALRITETRWFAGGHRGEVSFGRTKAFQCEKCHGGGGGGGGGGWGSGWFGR